jgi:hypothetical protein
MTWTIPITWRDGIPVFDIGGRTIIMDTGSPATLGTDVELCGRTARASSSLLTMMGDRFLPQWADGLVGLDFINRFAATTVDAGRMEVTFREGDVQPEGTPLDLLPSFYPDAPFVPVVIGGQRLRAYCDTGSTLTYIDPGLLARGPEVGEWNDYHPVAGDFTTPVHRVPVEVGGEPIELECGAMPETLGMGLGLMGADILVGSGLLRRRRVTFAPSRGKLFIQPYN